MSTAALIVAAGRGTRLGSDVPKQYIPLDGSCALRRTVELFLGLNTVGSVRVVIHADDRARYADALARLEDTRLLEPVVGGETRALSVRAGLEALTEVSPSNVVIHDAARPFMPPSVIEAVIDALKFSNGAAAALPVVDALWRAPRGLAEAPLPRENLWRAQTPQGFRFDDILAAHRAHDGTGADDVAVACEAGLKVQFVEGSEDGYKITSPHDLERALRDIATLKSA